MTALVEVEWVPTVTESARKAASNVYGTINVRSKRAWESETSVLLRRSFRGTDVRNSFDEASDTFRRAVAVAEFAELLRNSEHTEGNQFTLIRTILGSLTIGGHARTEMISLIAAAESLYGLR